MKYLELYIIFTLLILSCSKKDDNAGKTIIQLSDYKEQFIPNPFDALGTEPTYVFLDTGADPSFSFKGISKICHKNGLLYILDNDHKKLVVFDSSGTPVFKIDFRGRGPNEYLQITDFDVDERGIIWIVDAQKDRLFKYSGSGDMIESLPFSFEISKISCLDSKQLLVEIANWDTSKYSGTELAIADTLLNITSTILPYPKYNDPNYRFLSVISDSDQSVFFNEPIDDNLYEISFDGTIKNIYYFDFGQQKVPERYKLNIDLFYSQVSEHTFLAKSYKITPSYITCGIIRNGEWTAAIFNRKNNTVSYYPEKESDYHLVGQYNFGSIWYMYSCDNIDNISDDVLEWINSGKDVLILSPNNEK